MRKSGKMYDEVVKLGSNNLLLPTLSVLVDWKFICLSSIQSSTHVKFVKGACTQMQSKTKGIAWQPETLEDNINENKRIASFYFCIPKHISNYLVRLH